MEHAPDTGASAKAANAPGITIDTQIDAWIADKAREARCADSLVKSRRTIERLRDFHHWNDAAEATTPQIRDWLGRLRAGSLDWQQVKGKRRRSTPAGALRTGKRHNNVLTDVRTFFAFCAENPSRTNPWVRENPAAGIRKVPESDSDDGSRAFTTAELRALMATAGKPKREGDKRCSIDRKFVYMAAALLGVRWSTIGRMEWRMVDTEAREVRFPRGTVKKGRKTHAVPMCPELVECLNYWRVRQGVAGVSTGPTDRVFPRMPSPHSLERDAARAKIAIQTAKGSIGWHSFRKWWMTRVASKAQAPILHALSGHDSIATTMKHYVELDQLEGKSVIEAMPCLNGTYPPIGPTPVPEIEGKGLTRGRTDGKLSVPQSPMCYDLNHHDPTTAAPLGPAIAESDATAGRLLPGRGGSEAQSARSPEPVSSMEPGGVEPPCSIAEQDSGSRARLIASTLAQNAAVIRDFLRVQEAGLAALRALEAGSSPCQPSPLARA